MESAAKGSGSAVKALVIVGAGGHGRVVLDCAEASQMGPIAGFLDESKSGNLHGYPVLDFTRLEDPEFSRAHRFVIAIGDQAGRRRLFKNLSARGADMATIIHPAAWVSPRASIGPGSVLVGGVIVNTDAIIGAFCILNTGCSVDHDCVLLDGVQLCPGVRLAGGVRCGEDAFLGTGATVIPQIVIGKRAEIGAGGVVVRDVPPGAKVLGNPARVVAG